MPLSGTNELGEVRLVDVSVKKRSLKKKKNK